MKNTYLILSTNLLCMIFLLTTCSCKKNEPSIRLGSFGGFTGAETAFTISPSGKVSMNNFTTKDGKSDLKLKKSMVKAIFGKVLDAKISEIDYNVPGNMSNFLEINTKDKKNKIVWADGDESAPQVVKDIFEELNNSIRKQANE